MKTEYTLADCADLMGISSQMVSRLVANLQLKQDYHYRVIGKRTKLLNARGVNLMMTRDTKRGPKKGNVK